jgi:branched-subunit amino acid ABC-type transport system permease component
MNAVALSGAFVGLIYGLVAVCVVVAYRGSRVVSFATAETGMIGAFVFSEIRMVTSASGVVHDRGIWVALPAGIAVAAALGALTERMVVRPLRHAPRIRPMIGTVAVASLFAVFAGRRWGLSPRYAPPLVEGDGVRVAGLRVSPSQLLILGSSIAVLVGLWALYRFTRFGLRLRAAAEDPYGAGLVGVNVNRTSMATWALAGALAGLAAILIAPLANFDVLFMTTLSVRALAAALIGGLTNAGGAFGAGVLIGVAEAVITFKSPVSGVTDVALGAAVVLLMVMKPSRQIRLA